MNVCCGCWRPGGGAEGFEEGAEERLGEERWEVRDMLKVEELDWVGLGWTGPSCWRRAAREESFSRL